MWAFLETVVADGEYLGKPVACTNQKAHLALSIVKRPRAVPCFGPLPRGWVVERSFGWLITGRRRVGTFEQRAEVAETMIPIAAFATLLRRIM